MKMFAVPNNEKCPVKAFKVYAEKRLVEMKTDDAPFYLAVSNVKSGSGKPRLKKTPVGVNKLNTLMKTVAQKAGLGPNFKNLSGRNTMIQTLVNNDVPPTDIRVVQQEDGNVISERRAQQKCRVKLGRERRRVVLKSDLAVVSTNRPRYVCS